MNTYTYTVMLAKDNGRYEAICPALPKCRAYGQTKKEAIQNIKISMAHKLEVLKRSGRPIPRDNEAT